MKTKSALSYFGSDSEVAQGLAAMLGHCKHVTIPFVGGASIIPFLSARAILANDLHSLAINFYHVLAGRHGDMAKQRLIELCQHTLSHPAELEQASAMMQSECSAELRAWAFWANCWIGRKGKGGTKGNATAPSVRWKADGGTNASRIVAAADDLAAWANEFRRCEFLCRDFRDVLSKCADDESCGIYCDAPWPGAGDAYLHPFTELDHGDLRELLQRFEKTTVVVRYNDHPYIRALYDEWTIVDAESRCQSNAIKGEVWITNRHVDDETDGSTSRSTSQSESAQGV